MRTDHKRNSLSPSLPTRVLLKSADGIIPFSHKAEQHLIERLKLRANRICWVNPAIDTARFNPEKARRSLREKWALKESDVAVGVVARFQKYRKTDLFLEALKMAVPRAPNLKAALIGRSSQIKETVGRLHASVPAAFSLS